MTQQILRAPSARNFPTRLYFEADEPLIGQFSEVCFERIEFAGGVLSVHNEAYRNREINFTPGMNRALCLGALGLSRQTAGWLTKLDEETIASSRSKLFKTLGVTGGMRQVTRDAFRDGFFRVEAPAPPLERSLTDRQRNVLTSVADGKEYREIGEELGIGYESVRTHMAAINHKFDAIVAVGSITAAQLCGAIDLNADIAASSPTHS